MEKINILMATYNGRRYLRDQIDSILNQTYSDFRLLISDDASTDSTVKILEEYEKKDSRVEIYCHEKNLGVVSNFEFLINKVRSEYFMFADQDDIWEPDKIEKSLKKLKETGSDLVFTDLEVVDSKLNQIEPSFWKQKGFYDKIIKFNGFNALYLNNYINGCTMLCKSSWINEFLPLPKNSKYVIHDYWIALIVSQTGRIDFIPETTIKYRQHGNNQVGSSRKSDTLETLDEIRDLFLQVKIEHFETFVKNEKKFKTKELKQLNRESLEYFKDLKQKNKFNFKNWGLFFKLYKYEDFKYKMLNFIILNMPAIARIGFKIKKKRDLKNASINEDKK